MLINLLKLSRNGRQYATASYIKTPDINIEKLEQGILVLGLNRKSAKNSFSQTFAQNLKDVFEIANNDNSIRAIIMKSLVPGVFCAGADLKERLTMTNDEVYSFVTKLRKLMNIIENSQMPVLAAINGAALGGGLEMALACDIRIASKNAKIGLVETKLAIIPGAGGTQRLSRIVGVALAKELIYTGRIINGTEAEKYGIVNHCVDSNSDDPAFDKALNIAQEIAKNGPIGVRMAKKAINKGIEVDLNSAFAIEELCYAQIIPTKDRIEGLKAFGEKRTPIYQGN